MNAFRRWLTVSGIAALIVAASFLWIDRQWYPGGDLERALAQSSDCSMTATLNTSSSTSTPASFKPTSSGGTPCISWVVMYWTNNATGVSVKLEGAADVAGSSSGSYTALTAASGSANPATGTTSGSIVLCCDYYPWLRFNASTFTGTGRTMTIRAYGYRAPSATASGGGGSGGGYETIEDEGTPLTQRAILNFIGAGVTCADDAGNVRTNCTIPGGGGGLSVDGYYLKDGSTYYIGPTNQVATLPSAGTYAWVNQGSATETASGNALTLSSPPTTSNSIHARTVAIGGATSLTVAMICTGTPVNFTTCGIGFRESATGKLTTMQLPVYGVTESLNSVVDWTNPTTYGGTTPFTGGSIVCGTYWGRLLFGMTTITYQLSCDGVNFVTLVTENKNAFFTTAPDQWHYYVDSATATGTTNALLLSWSAL